MWFNYYHESKILVWMEPVGMISLLTIIFYKLPYMLNYLPSVQEVVTHFI